MAEIVDRERRKIELKKRLVDPKKLKAAPSGNKSGHRHRRSRRLLLAFGLLLLLLLGAGGIYYLLFRQYHGYELRWTQNFSSDGQVVNADFLEYTPFADGMLKLTRDGASYIDASGKVIWDQAYEMTKPIYDVRDNYCVIADEGQNQLYIMSSSGLSGQAKTRLPIIKVCISAGGVVYTLTEENTASYINVFTREATPLDISIKSVLSGDGYPLDLAVSPDGTQCMASFAFLENGSIQNRVVFYNLDEIGKNAGSNRVVGGFVDDFKDHLSGRVHFSGNDYAQAFYDGGIAFFSTKVLTSPELLQKVEFADSMLSIAYNKDYVALVTANSDGAEPYCLRLYRVNGSLVFEKKFSFPYTQVQLNAYGLLLYNESQVQLYNLKGKLRFEHEMNMEIRTAALTGRWPSPSLMLGNVSHLEGVRIH